MLKHFSVFHSIGINQDDAKSQGNEQKRFGGNFHCVQESSRKNRRTRSCYLKNLLVGILGELWLLWSTRKAWFFSRFHFIIFSSLLASVIYFHHFHVSITVSPIALKLITNLSRHISNYFLSTKSRSRLLSPTQGLPKFTFFSSPLCTCQRIEKSTAHNFPQQLFIPLLN